MELLWIVDRVEQSLNKVIVGADLAPLLKAKVEKRQGSGVARL
jgi:hypothetical protein